jgi:hypothetical protein
VRPPRFASRAICLTPAAAVTAEDRARDQGTLGSIRWDTRLVV